MIAPRCPRVRGAREYALGPRHVLPAQRHEFSDAEARVCGDAEELRQLAVLLPAQVLRVDREVGPLAPPDPVLGGPRQRFNLLDREDLEMPRILLAALARIGHGVLLDAPAGALVGGSG